MTPSELAEALRGWAEVERRIPEKARDMELAARYLDEYAALLASVETQYDAAYDYAAYKAMTRCACSAPEIFFSRVWPMGDYCGKCGKAI